MEEIISDETNNAKNNSQQQYEINSEEKSNKNNYISTMNEEETAIWLKNLNLNEEILKELEKIIKNGKDIISIYNNNKLLEKINLDLHSNNVINDAIEKGLEEQLKITIYLEKEKNIILNIEHEPKYKLKELLSYLEKMLKRTVYLSPYNSPNEILNPNTLIVKKILLNPNRYCNLKLFDEKTIRNNNIISDYNNLMSHKSDNDNINTNTNINKIKNETLLLNNNDITNINTNINKNNDLISTNTNTNTNNSKISNKSKGYTSLFQNKKSNIPDFSTDYQMPSHNKSNGNNYIKLDNKNKNITPSKQIENFKYQNILNKEENKILNDMRFKNDNNDNSKNEPKNIGFKNISNFKNIDAGENDNNNNNNNMNKNYLTQRNFNSKTISNDNNNMMFQQILNKKRSEKSLSGITGKNTIDNLGNDNNNISLLDRNNLDKEKDMFHLDFLGKDNNNEIKKQTNNKTESRYEFSRFQDLDKDNIFKNKNIFNLPKTDPENNDINNLIINNQNEELKNSKEKYGFNNNLKEESDNDILKILREKYSMQNNDSKDSDNNNKFNFEINNDRKPKTPINEARRIINNDNMKFNNKTTDNSNNPLENQFLLQQKDEYIKFNNNFLNNNNQQMYNMKQDDDDNNFISKFKIDINDKNNILGKNRMNRPSSGLDIGSFKYKSSGYKSTFTQDEDNNLNQYNQNNE